MLDVHPPHQAAHSWKDFFIHIATIVIGLLIAVGLEQTVEYVHRRHEMLETREALHHEHDLNVKLAEFGTEEFRRMVPFVQTDLAIFLYLRKHPGASPRDLPGKLNFYQLSVRYFDSAWKTAQGNNALALLPPSEVRRETAMYRGMEITSEAGVVFKDALYEARRFMFADPDPTHLTPAEVDREIDLIEKAILAEVRLAGAMRNHANRYGEFEAPTQQEIVQILNYDTADDDPALPVLQKKLDTILRE